MATSMIRMPTMNEPSMFPGGVGSGSNQFFPNMPSMPVFNTPQATSGTGSGGGTPSSTPWNNPPGGNFSFWGTPEAPKGGANVTGQNLGSGIWSEAPIFSGMAGNWENFLASQMGHGVPANPLLQQMMQFLGGGQSSMPGANTLSTIANKGISALPEWQSMIGAQQQNIQQNQANLREQFAGMGNLAGSPFGTAMSNYMQQTTADQNSLLGQLQQQNILQGQIPASEFLQGQASQMSQFGQSLLPQYNPMNSFMQQLSETFAPMYNTKKGGGILGGLIPSLAGGAGSGIASLLGGSGGMESILAGLAGLCNVAASFWGWDDPRTHKVQFWMLTQADPDVAMFYLRNGWWLAQSELRMKFKPLFDSIVAA